MKKNIFLALIITGLLNGCSSGNDSNEGFNTYVRFDMNGQHYDMPNPSTNATGSSGSIMAPAFFGDPPNQSIVIDMPFLPTVGNHNLTHYTGSGNYAAYLQIAPGVTFDSESGTIKIISISNDFVKGTFGFTGTVNGTTYTITDGEFRSFRAEDLTN
ncbi:hypothetical protein [Flavobacterium sp. 3HN19-14]|uniref:hypothetical protein n=1 Tax=Flavobacterium sp. 3HN19-14 TaxID=3448133 RepID=UPI003EE207B2